jgi:hypothetical protein
MAKAKGPVKCNGYRLRIQSPGAPNPGSSVKFEVWEEKNPRAYFINPSNWNEDKDLVKDILSALIDPWPTEDFFVTVADDGRHITGISKGKPPKGGDKGKGADKAPASDPDVAALVKLWPRIPTAIRDGILSIVKASAE